MTTDIILFLLLLQVKHWYIDFVNQSDSEVKSKGIYGDFHGIMHSAKHGFGTLICALMVTGYTYLIFSIVLAIVDFVTHYHIDWVKMNYGNRDISTPAFWNHLGLDQMAHQVIYLLLAFFMS
jgi:hypothetical protein